MLNEFIQVFKALSDTTRIRILHILLKAKRELCICEIMDSLNIAQYNVSKHIKELKLAGFLKERKEGRFVFYSISLSNKFHKMIIESIKSIPKEFFEKDDILLKKRLSLRKRGKVVIGMKGGIYAKRRKKFRN
jgi:ArsR family transcriptional regulator